MDVAGGGCSSEAKTRRSVRDYGGLMAAREAGRVRTWLTRPGVEHIIVAFLGAVLAAIRVPDVLDGSGWALAWYTALVLVMAWALRDALLHRRKA